jgi:predicted lactoylglutathione lyase
MPASKVFINLPVKDLKKSIEFFTKVGYTFNPQFTDETATCMIINETIYSMLLTHEKFQSFMPPGMTISDNTNKKEVFICLSFDSRAEVDAVVERAIAAGAKPITPAQDHGFMYERNYEDLDGHVWEHFWMDPSFAPPQ